MPPFMDHDMELYMYRNMTISISYRALAVRPHIARLFNQCRGKVAAF